MKKNVKKYLPQPLKLVLILIYCTVIIIAYFYGWNGMFVLFNFLFIFGFCTALLAALVLLYVEYDRWLNS